MSSSDTSLWIGNLDPSLPAGSEKLSDGDDSIRHTKQVTRDTFPQMVGAVTMSDTTINHLDANIKTDASQLIIDINNGVNPTMTVNVNEVNLNGKKLNNINGVPDTDADVPNKGYNDARYYTQDQLDTYIAATQIQLDEQKEQAWPIGSVFMSTKVTTEADVAIQTGVGTWTRRAQGRFIVGVGEATQNGVTRNYGVGNDIWGAATIRLAESQMPSHFHTLMGQNLGTNSARLTWDTTANAAQKFSYNYTEYNNGTTTVAGSGAHHENSPQAYGMYVYERTA